MRETELAEIIEGPEPPVAALAELEPCEEVPPHLDRAVRGEIRRRLRDERVRPPWWRRTPAVAAMSGACAAAATVVLIFAIQPLITGDGGPEGAREKGPGGVSAAEVHLDYLVQRPGETSPARLGGGTEVGVGDGVYLRADLTRPGILTFLADSPGAGWEPLVTQQGVVGANDLQREGKIQVFYVTEAGLYRFAAVWSSEHPPEDWNPGEGTRPQLDPLGDQVEVAWVELEARQLAEPP